MLRALVALLLLANVGFFAWQLGWLDTVVGASAQQGREPQRLKAQVNPERLIVLGIPAPQQTAAGSSPVAAASNASEASSEPASAASAPLDAASAASGAAAVAASTAIMAMDAGCREAGPFTPDEYRLAEAQFKQLPPGSWNAQTVTVQGLWLVYMGPYPDDDTYVRKQVELRRIKGLTFEEVRSPAKLAMGLALGRYQSEPQALAALESLKARGVRTAYVVNIRPTMDFTVVRVERAAVPLQKQLSALPLPAGKGFAVCPP
jgi:hypothetical protein